MNAQANHAQGCTRELRAGSVDSTESDLREGADSGEADTDLERGDARSASGSIRRPAETAQRNEQIDAALAKAHELDSSDPRIVASLAYQALDQAQFADAHAWLAKIDGFLSM